MEQSSLSDNIVEAQKVGEVIHEKKNLSNEDKILECLKIAIEFKNDTLNNL